MKIANESERERLIEAGRRLGAILETLRAKVAPGVLTDALDDLAERLIREGGDEPAFLGYAPEGARRPYPATLCVSVNDEIVHGIPNEAPKALKEGDIVGLDLGLRHAGIIADAAITVGVGKVADESLRLMRATEEALAAGIEAAKPGSHTGDIGAAIEKVIERAGFTVVRDLGGHAVGDRVHEEPFIANFGKPGHGPELEEGMVLALEPIAAVGKGAIILRPDGYTYATRDGSRSAHFEHTILLEKGGATVVTRA
ncbi:MAG: type I methionyl aminopeptidase [Patescibacteria group bacterium]|nr:type I methionyl aminopeptidase [Patescibacteria group bacterium]MDE1944118.1 type I methionyl aminopeptidase [Patescibacteria group bacterium]MDE1945051.1 type I methionyl aminopeptidase [Patescibacteria group bacterium]MDE2057511.1 type I methionyl aminopeptidase [Patescibacteria group bacterium]